MAKVKTLRDSNGVKVYPITSSTAVVSPDGKTMTEYFGEQMDEKFLETEGTATSTDTNTRWGKYNANEGTQASTDTNTRWGKFNAAEVNRDTKIATAEAAATSSAASAASSASSASAAASSLAQIDTKIGEMTTEGQQAAAIAVLDGQVTELASGVDSIAGVEEKVIASNTTTITGTETSNITLLYDDNLTFHSGDTILLKVPQYADVCNTWSFRVNGGGFAFKTSDTFEYKCTGDVKSVGIYLYYSSLTYLHAGELTASISTPAIVGKIQELSAELSNKANKVDVHNSFETVESIKTVINGASFDFSPLPYLLKFYNGVTTINYKSNAVMSWIRLEKGDVFNFTLSDITNFSNPSNYYIYASLNIGMKQHDYDFNNGQDVSSNVIEGLLYSSWVESEKSKEFSYQAKQDCYLYIAVNNTSTISNIVLTKNARYAIDCETKEREETECIISVRTNMAVNTSGSVIGSSLNELHSVKLNGVNRVKLHTIANGANMACATYDYLGNVKRTFSLRNNIGVTNQYLLDDIDIVVNSDEYELKYVVAKNINQYHYAKFYTENNVKKQIEGSKDITPFNDLETDNENISYLFARMMNSRKMAKDMIDNKLFEYATYGDPSDCTMVYDSNYHYIVGVKMGATGSGKKYNDIAQGDDCGIMLIKVSRTDYSSTNQLLLVEGQSVTCTDGNTYTIQRGGSMPNAVIKEGKLYIIFSTMVNDTFVMMRCIFNPATNSAESYSICKFADAPMTYAGLVQKGYNLQRFDDLYMNKTMNMNAWYGNAKASDGSYYVGMCLCGSYKYPFVLKTSDFETFEVWKQIEQPHSRATFELSTCLSSDGNTLYTALRNSGRYVIVNSIDVTTKEIISTDYVRGASSRPCLYLGHDNAVYMYYTMENARQSGRIMRISDRNNQVKIADIMQQVQYAELQKADDGQNYFYFVFNRIFKVNPHTYTFLDANETIDKIMEL